MSDNFREFKSQGEENYSDQTKKSGNGRQAGAVSRKTVGTQAGTKKTLSGIRKVWAVRKRGCADWYGQAKTDC